MQGGYYQTEMSEQEDRFISTDSHRFLFFYIGALSAERERLSTINFVFSQCLNVAMVDQQKLHLCYSITRLKNNFRNKCSNSDIENLSICRIHNKYVNIYGRLHPGRELTAIELEIFGFAVKPIKLRIY